MKRSEEEEEGNCVRKKKLKRRDRVAGERESCDFYFKLSQGYYGLFTSSVGCTSKNVGCT